MSRLLLAAACVGLAILPLTGQTPDGPSFKIDFVPERDVALLDKDASGRSGLFVNVKFTITIEGQARPEDAATEYKIVIDENNHRVHEADVPRPTPAEELAVVLAMDTSGSMTEGGRMEKSRPAAEFFLRKLPVKSDCGLVLFNHEIRSPVLAPQRDREPLLKVLREVEPRGGTGYFDAATRAIQLLASAPRHQQRYLLLMTDGVDINSTATLPGVTQLARLNKVKILSIGIGEPGKQEPVTTVLALDHSGSMIPPANDQDRVSKIHALHKAASRFIAIMPPTASSSILPFSTAVGTPGDFTNDRASLIRQIQALKAEGETAILDATYDAVATLDASGRAGKRAVIAMTDGVDNSSRRRVEEVIARALDARVPLYMLGFGRLGELDASIMQRMAEETGGRYYHAVNERSLLEIFENLAIQLHDDGIDEISLRRLAQETGGQYFPVKNISELDVILEKVQEAIQHKQYEITFPSLLQKRDGTRRLVTIKLIRRSGELASNTPGGLVQFGEQVLESKETGYQTHGLVLAEMHPLVYVLLLMGLGALLVLPSFSKIFSAI